MEETEKNERKREYGNAGRCSKARTKLKYAKKRRYHGKNKRKCVNNDNDNFSETQTSASNSTDKLAAKSTASSSKVIDVDLPSSNQLNSKPTSSITGYRLVDMLILSKVFSLLGCPECHDVDCLKLNDNDENKKGLARQLILKCSSCLYSYDFYTSREVNLPKRNKGGRKLRDINVRAVYGCRQVGLGYQHLKKLCCFMNMPSPMLLNSFDKITKRLTTSAKQVAERSMSDAALKLRGNAATADVGISIGGTWQRKGYTSMNGIITAISIDNGKVLDSVILSKNCKACTSKNLDKSTKKISEDDYNDWYESHKVKCKLNHKGSSPAMETVGAETIFNRSVAKHQLYYTSFYGDGDSKAYPAVQHTYGPAKPVTKFECIGHYQKRVGSRLRKKKKDVKGLGGRGRLTDAKIDILQNYFGIALRQNTGNLDKMVSATKASMYHVAGYHDNCPKDENSWCKFQLDKLNGTDTYKYKGGFPSDVRKAILPVYMDLCKPENLAKCLHGRTQNANESFNGMIWNRVPKANHVGVNILSLGTYDAIAHFNEGAIAAINILKGVHIMQPGKYMREGLNLISRERGNPLIAYPINRKKEEKSSET